MSLPMPAHLAVLKLTLDAIGGNADADQKIYLAKYAGVDLGYGFGWFGKHVRSMALGADLSVLDEEHSLGHEVLQTLTPAQYQRLAIVTKVQTPPPWASTVTAEWPNVLVTIHFLSRTYAAKPDRTEDVLERHYPAYLPLVGPTRELLERTFLTVPA